MHVWMRHVASTVVIANGCNSTTSEATVVLLKQYITRGGSIVVMGDNFCVGAGDGPPWYSSAELASKITREWGIEFTTDDDSQIQLFEPTLAHPITAHVQRIYSFRHAYLTVSGAARPLFVERGKSFLALYDGIGTIVAIPDIGFHWNRDAAPFPPAPANDNFVLWHNMLQWLIDRSRIKRSSRPPIPSPCTIGCPPTSTPTPTRTVTPTPTPCMIGCDPDLIASPTGTPTPMEIDLVGREGPSIDPKLDE